MIQEEHPSPYHNHEDPLANVYVTPLMVEYLKATKPWVRFISIMMFILAGFMVLVGLVMVFAGSALGNGGVGFGPLVGIIYIVMSGLYLVPAFFLFQYASHINDLVKGGGDSAMESALESQKSFWRFMGIITLVVLCLYALIFVFAIFIGISGAAYR